MTEDEKQRYADDFLSDLELFKDVFFAVRGIPKGYPYLAARQATLFRFAGVHVGYPQAEGSMRVWWRLLLYYLFKAGNGDKRFPLTSRLKTQFARNCPPACTLTQIKSKLCRQTYLCPYCRGRLAVDAYSRLAAVAFPTTVGCAVNQMQVVLTEHCEPFHQSWLDTAERVREQFYVNDADRVFRRSRATAAVSYKQPYVDHDEALLRLRTVTVLLGDEIVPFAGNGEVTLYTGKELKRKAVCAATSLALAYPFQLFPDSLDITELWDCYRAMMLLTQRHRLFRTYGGCYGSGRK